MMDSQRTIEQERIDNYLSRFPAFRVREFFGDDPTEELPPSAYEQFASLHRECGPDVGIFRCMETGHHVTIWGPTTLTLADWLPGGADHLRAWIYEGDADELEILQRLTRATERQRAV